MQDKKDRQVFGGFVDYQSHEWHKEGIHNKKKVFDIATVRIAVEKNYPDFYRVLKKRHELLRRLYADYIKKVYHVELPSRSNKIGRNNPCPCGSGKKYKKCCGR